MKKLKLDHELARLVLKGKKTSTWRLFDDKDLSINDDIEFIDKVDPDDSSTWQSIGIGKVDGIIQKRLGSITERDMEGHEKLDSVDSILKRYQKYYGPNVTADTPVKIVHFSFSTSAQETDSQADDVEVLPATQSLIVYADGGSRGNPGPSASGYVIYDSQHRLVMQKGVYLGITTNNQAEYTALKLVLEQAKKLNATDIKVYMDSLLVINQMNGIFKVKNRDLWPIHDAIRQQCEQFRHISFMQVPRAANKLADAAVNEALDKAQDVVIV